MATPRTLATKLLPTADGLRLDDVSIGSDQIVATLEATSPRSTCPVCGIWSEAIHSRYQRTIADLPWGDQAVHLRLQVRRFFCRQPNCVRRIFTERLPSVAAPYARRSRRQAELVGLLAFVLGGELGARIAGRLRLAASPATMLRLIRRAAVPERPTPRVLGVDDWARRRGQTYGTILVDQERHVAIELLPDRTAETLAGWLRSHPGVEIICRDRAGAYADGARQGAPEALQVADRWHLLANVGELLERVIRSHHPALREAATAVDRAATETVTSSVRTPASVVAPAPTRVTRAQQEQQTRRASRLARYEEVIALHRAGHSQVAIGEQVGLDRKTIRRYLRADGFPERAAPGRRATILAPYEPYLRARWADGCHNARQLWREIREQGFPGAAAIVRRHVACWRTVPARRGRSAQSPSDAGRAPRRLPTRVRSPRQARWLMLRDADALDADERLYPAALLDASPAIREAQHLAERFGRLIRTRDRQALDAWFIDAVASPIPEIRSFAAGLRRDQPAVVAAVTVPWSNGQTEGHVHKLKLLKRSIYGRANFDLLRLRVLNAA
jgi:transposase